MLGQQFFASTKYGPFVHKHFIPMQSISGDADRDAIEERYEIGGHPSVLIIKPDGSLHDIIAGYRGRDPAIYREAVEKSLEGSESYAAVKARFDQDPDNLETMFALADKYQDMRYVEKAAMLSEKILGRADEAKAKVVTYQGQRINLYEVSKYGAGMGNWYSRRSPEGLEAFRAEFPQSVLIDDAYSNLANFYLRLPPSDEADAFFDDLKDKYTDNASLLNALVRYYIKTAKHLDEGETVAAKVIELNPDNTGYRMNAALLFIRNGKEKEAMQYYGDAFIQGHKDDADQLARYARWWSDKTSNLESALKYAKAAVGLKPDASRYNTLGRVYRYMKDYENALQAVEKAVELDPENEDANKHLELIKETMAKG